MVALGLVHREARAHTMACFDRRKPYCHLIFAEMFCIKFRRENISLRGSGQIVFQAER